MNDDTERCPATNRQGEQCGHPAGWGTDNDSGPCKFHGGATEGAGAPEGNDNAVTVGAWAEDFYDGFLTEAEQDRVEKSAEILGDNAGAQEVARHAASVCLEQFRRTGDERFMRRYESICDKAGIFPEEEIDVSGDVTVTEELGEDKKAMMAELFDREVQNE
jgi:hypothetical protein